MAKLTAKKRKALPKSSFGEPGKRAYPMPDRTHAIDAKGRAKEELDKHKLSKAEYARIIAMANKKLG